MPAPGPGRPALEARHAYRNNLGRRNTTMTHKNTICVWYEKDAEPAARFYAKTFPESALGAIRYAPGDYPPANRAKC